MPPPAMLPAGLGPAAAAPRPADTPDLGGSGGRAVVLEEQSVWSLSWTGRPQPGAPRRSGARPSAVSCPLVPEAGACSHLCS